MRNQNISTEILGDLKTARKVGVQDDNLATGTSQANDESPERDAPKSRPYAVATLDGTIMLVQDEIILWYAYKSELNILYLNIAMELQCHLNTAILTNFLLILNVLYLFLKYLKTVMNS